MKYLIIITFSIFVFLFSSCEENVDPAKGEINLQMIAVTELNSINSSARIAETGIEFTEIIMGVTEIELEGSIENEIKDEDDEDDDVGDDGNEDHDDHGNHEYEIEYEGQFIVDLLNGISEPDFGISNIFPGEYKELEIKVSPILEDNKSIRIRLNLIRDDMEPMPVEISTFMAFELEIEHQGGIQIDLNAPNQILVLFDLDKLIQNVNWSNLEIDDDGVARINESTNTAIFESIRAAFYTAFDACEDNNDDDKFDDHDQHEHDD